MAAKLRERHQRAVPAAQREDSQAPQRLQKILAAAGVGSRRQCEEFILAGRVEVDRQVITALGAKADPSSQVLRVDGVELRLPRLRYYAVYKPVGVVSTNRDPAGRPRVVDLLPPDQRLFTVGRLDMSSEGLMLATNDGELANRLAHPRYGVEKTYVVEVVGSMAREDLQTLRRGAHLAEAFARPVHVHVRSQHKKSTIVEIVLNEGRNREIRRLLARLGHKVLHLRRVALGPLRLGDLPPGGVRPLRREEIRDLFEAAYGAGRKRRKRDAAHAVRSKSAAGSLRVSESPHATKAAGGRTVPAGRKRIRVTAHGKLELGRTAAGQFGTVIGGPKPAR